MARARNIKPSLFKNEVLGVADALLTILFEGLWVLADRSGKLEDRPLRIKGEIFPYREGLDIESMLTWLEAKGFIRRYVSQGKRCILVCEFVKHQNPHKNESASELPDPEEIGKSSEIIGSAPADSLSSDSLFLIPDSPIPSKDFAPPPGGDEAPTAKAKRIRVEPKAPAPSSAAFDSYARAYQDRYGFEPVRNAKVNGQFSNLVNRLGADEAPGVARFYVGHQDRLYVKAMHCVDLLLRDAEKLRTEWVSGQVMTSTKAMQADKTATNLDAFQPLIDAAKAREAKERSNA